MKKNLCFVLFVLFHHICVGQDVYNRSKNSETNSIVARSEKIIHSGNSLVPNVFADFNDGHTTTRLEGYVDSLHNIQKLIIKGIDDKGNKYVEYFYFDYQTGSIIYLWTVQDGKAIYIFTRQRNVIFYQNIKGKEDICELDTLSKESSISTFMSKLDPYLALLKLKRETVSTSLLWGPGLQTSCNGVEFRTSPHGKVIRLLNLHEQLFYLGCTKDLDNQKNLKWVWYKVATKDNKQIGWVFGHPKYIMELNDEDGED